MITQQNWQATEATWTAIYILGDEAAYSSESSHEFRNVLVASGQHRPPVPPCKACKNYVYRKNFGGGVGVGGLREGGGGLEGQVGAAWFGIGNSS